MATTKDFSKLSTPELVKAIQVAAVNFSPVEDESFSEFPTRIEMMRAELGRRQERAI